MQDTDKKQNNFLKKLKELDLKIDIEKEKVKHNNLIKEEFENINASYNRCLDILSRSATGKNINSKYNEYTGEQEQIMVPGAFNNGEAVGYEIYILINEFILDNYKMKNQKVVIVHGNGTGIIKKTTQETLRTNKLVEEYKIDNFNTGMTVVVLKKR